MNKYKERFSVFVSNNKKKIIIGMSSLWLLAVFNMPTINWLREKYIQHNKIDKRPQYEHDIQQLFDQLWYTDRAHTLRMNDTNDIDLGHLKGSKDTMDNLLRQFHSLQETNERKTISIPGSWTGLSIVKTDLQATYDCQVLRDIQDRFDLSEDETIFILSTLMHLALSEYIEEQQAKELYTRRTTASWNNSVDFRGNIAGVIAILDDDNEKYDTDVPDLQKILNKLQKYYKTDSARLTFDALWQDFDLQVQIVDKK